jgi:hypothetical protein
MIVAILAFLIVSLLFILLSVYTESSAFGWRGMSMDVEGGCEYME